MDDPDSGGSSIKLLFAMLFAVCFLVSLFVIFGVEDK
jgi:hypothetical protein